jgi:hypothetical protein
MICSLRKVLKAVLSPGPRPHDPEVQVLLDASRSGNETARAVLKEFGRLAAEEQRAMVTRAFK